MEVPKAILFDADGTLYESEKIGYEASRQTALELCGFNLSWETYETAVIRGSMRTDELLASLGMVVDKDDVQANKAARFEHFVDERLQPISGLHDFLDWCKGSNIICIVVSANRRAAIDICLKALDIADYFTDIISIESLDAKRKPDP